MHSGSRVDRPHIPCHFGLVILEVRGAGRGRCLAALCLAIRLLSGCQARDFSTRRTCEGHGGPRRREPRHPTKRRKPSLRRSVWKLNSKPIGRPLMRRSVRNRMSCGGSSAGTALIYRITVSSARISARSNSRHNNDFNSPEPVCRCTSIASPMIRSVSSRCRNTALLRGPRGPPTFSVQKMKKE
jgi:hypothetical protein